jgi:hypothetical protein
MSINYYIINIILIETTNHINTYLEKYYFDVYIIFLPNIFLTIYFMQQLSLSVMCTYTIYNKCYRVIK